MSLLRRIFSRTEGELVHPSMPKPGLRMQSQCLFDEMIRTGVITRRMLAQAGFIIVEFDRRFGESELEDDFNATGDWLTVFDTAVSDNLFPHHENVQRQNFFDMPVIALRSNADPLQRKSQTLVGERSSVFRRAVEVASRFPRELESSLIFAELMRDIRARGKAALTERANVQDPRHVLKDLEDLYEIGRSPAWIDVLFRDETDKDLAAVTPYFCQRANDVLYRHTWQPNQLMLVDDSAMVHGRLFLDEDAQSVLPVYRDYFRWRFGGALVSAY